MGPKLDTTAVQLANTAAALAGLLNGTWVTASPASGWSNRGGSYPPLRVMKSGNLMLVQGTLAAAGTVANGGTVGTFGSGYYNSTYIQTIIASQYQGTAVCTSNELHIEIGLSGAVLVWGISSSGSIGLSFNGFAYLKG